MPIAHLSLWLFPTGSCPTPPCFWWVPPLHSFRSTSQRSCNLWSKYSVSSPASWGCVPFLQCLRCASLSARSERRLSPSTFSPWSVVQSCAFGWQTLGWQLICRCCCCFSWAGYGKPRCCYLVFTRQYSWMATGSNARPLFIDAVWATPFFIRAARRSAELWPRTWQISLKREDVILFFLTRCHSTETFCSLVATSILLAISKLVSRDCRCSCCWRMHTNWQLVGFNL